MTLCHNNDQTWFSDTLTSARLLGGRLNTRLSDSGFSTTLGVQQILMHRKNMFDPYRLVYRFQCMTLYYSQTTRSHMILKKRLPEVPEDVEMQYNID